MEVCLTNVCATELYKPKTLEDVVGNKLAINEIYSWFLSDKTKDLIILGGSGVGKTLTVDLCVAKTKVNAIYFAASELNRKTLETQIKPIVNNFFVQNRIIIIDGIDELVSLSIPEIKRAAQVPVVFIGKRVNTKVSLKKNQKVEFKKIYKKDILPFIKAIAKAEKIKISKSALDELVAGNNDIRSILIAIRNVNFECKDITLDKFALLKMVCQKPMKLQEIEKLVGDDTAYLQLLIQENYLNFNPDPLQRYQIAEAISLNEIVTPDPRCLHHHSYAVEATVNKILPSCSVSRFSLYSNPYINTLPSRQRSRQSLLTFLKQKGLDRDRIDFLQIILNAKRKPNYQSYGIEDISIIKNLLIS
jgi:hypothetical protein